MALRESGRTVGHCEWVALPPRDRGGGVRTLSLSLWLILSLYLTDGCRLLQQDKTETRGKRRGVGLCVVVAAADVAFRRC